MADWMNIISNENELYAIEMADGEGNFYVASEWFATQEEAQAFAEDVVSARVSAIARAAVKAANDTLGKTVEMTYSE